MDVSVGGESRFANHAKHTHEQQCRVLHHDHGRRERVTYVDHAFSSALYFTGWKEEHLEPRPPDNRMAPLRSWLLRTGYRRGGGLISVDEPPTRPR